MFGENIAREDECGQNLSREEDGEGGRALEVNIICNYDCADGYRSQGRACICVDSAMCLEKIARLSALMKWVRMHSVAGRPGVIIYVSLKTGNVCMLHAELDIYRITRAPLRLFASPFVEWDNILVFECARSGYVRVISSTSLYYTRFIPETHDTHISLYCQRIIEG